MNSVIKSFLGSFKVGAAVHFPCRISTDEVDNDNLYVIKIVDPVITDKGVVHETALHLFTEKELSRACDRYYGECDNVINHFIDATGKTTIQLNLGYLSIITYNGKDNCLTTRAMVRFDGSSIESLNNERSCVGLFTAREFKRSKDRMNWYLMNKTHPYWFSFKLWLGRLFNVKISS